VIDELGTRSRSVEKLAFDLYWMKEELSSVSSGGGGRGKTKTCWVQSIDILMCERDTRQDKYAKFELSKTRLEYEIEYSWIEMSSLQWVLGTSCSERKERSHLDVQPCFRLVEERG
jgi:hypothetical protein